MYASRGRFSNRRLVPDAMRVGKLFRVAPSCKSRRGREFSDRRISPAGDLVIIHHADRLHERVTDRRADKFVAAREQRLAHGVRFRGVGGRGADVLPASLNGAAPDKTPKEGVEAAKFGLDSQS